MDATNVAIWITRLLFGAVAAAACLMLLFGIFIFDAPGSASVWSINLAAAPLVYLYLYALSLSPPAGIDGQPPVARARLLRTFLPVIGLAWYGLAWVAIANVCGGNFSC